MHNPKTKTDAEIVKLAIQNDQYFGILIERYEKKMFAYISRLAVLNKETIEDLLQEVFIKVYQNLNDFDEQFSLSSWIYRITHNVVISHLRNVKRTPIVKSMNDEDFNKNFIDLLPSDVDIPKEIARKEVGKRVHRSLLELPEKYREVLVLYYLEDKSYKEISDILERSIGSVSVLINRAKLKFKAILCQN
jgi:RNA polymerase sigma-70 factor (ECF subfamily)